MIKIDMREQQEQEVCALSASCLLSHRPGSWREAEHITLLMLVLIKT